MIKHIPIKDTPDWVKEIIEWEGPALPEELAEAKKKGNKFFRGIRSKEGPPFLICYNQETGEPVDIIWIT